MKDDLVRIGAERAKKLNEVAYQMMDCKPNDLVRRAIDLWLEIEAPVYLAAFKEAREKLKERHPVAS